MGYYLTLRLLEQGHNVTILNRGMSKDELPETIHRLRADRTDSQQMKRALLAKSFDAVVDFVLYQQAEAETIVNLLSGRVGHYLYLSSGQVYLVREGIERPFSEAAYEGRLQPSPKANTYAYEEWRYGMGKREAENTIIQAGEKDKFPYTSLRLPMVNSERDSFRRLYNYYLRLQDGGAILLPETPNYPLRHVYAGDVVNVLDQLVNHGQGIGQAYNLSQDETVSIDEFLQILGQIMGITPQLVRVKRSLLEANGFLPDCSPFSERWMSELDNSRSKRELGIQYTPLKDYLQRLVDYYQQHKILPPIGYKRRNAEIQMAKEVLEQG